MAVAASFARRRRERGINHFNFAKKGLELNSEVSR
jgi:hypothetical protein